MDLSPEEKQRIYAEEKARMEAQQKAKQEQDAKNTKTGCIGCLSVIAIIVLIGAFTGLFSENKKETATQPSTIDINASVRFTGTQFVITNNDDFDWTDVKFEVNSGFIKGGYILHNPVVKAKTVYTVGALRFAKSDGTRFDPFAIKPQNMSISCETPSGHGFYYGGWD